MAIIQFIYLNNKYSQKIDSEAKICYILKNYCNIICKYYKEFYFLYKGKSISLDNNSKIKDFKNNFLYQFLISIKKNYKMIKQHVQYVIVLLPLLLKMIKYLQKIVLINIILIIYLLMNLQILLDLMNLNINANEEIVYITIINFIFVLVKNIFVLYILFNIVQIKLIY